MCALSAKCAAADSALSVSGSPVGSKVFVEPMLVCSFLPTVHMPFAKLVLRPARVPMDTSDALELPEPLFWVPEELAALRELLEGVGRLRASAKPRKRGSSVSACFHSGCCASLGPGVLDRSNVRNSVSNCMVLRLSRACCSIVHSGVHARGTVHDLHVLQT